MRSLNELIKQYKYSGDWNYGNVGNQTYYNLFITPPHQSSSYMFDTVGIVESTYCYDVCYWNPYTDWELDTVLKSLPINDDNLKYLIRWIEKYARSFKGIEKSIKRLLEFDYHKCIHDNIFTRSELQRFFFTSIELDNDEI
jgi:hypothetical protein